ncbi:Leucine Rich repeats (2 copies) [Anatilimnocola aggregata]|uniref:Leucine Rich repeats (2 copies) n=2 Tax=Anatilimnocola aggregata TaxID=2528021 RepID=A0A517YEU5_9BACT|nr:Leucine Rich repeats (2 copies) [Anatilimnocola aggregata]
MSQNFAGNARLRTPRDCVGGTSRGGWIGVLCLVGLRAILRAGFDHDLDLGVIMKRAMSRANLAVVAMLVWSVGSAFLLTGCPTPEPKQPANGGPQTPEIETPGATAAAKDDPAAIDALKAAGATLKMDKAGNVGEVALTQGNNDDLKHLAKLPHVTVLSAEVRGITGEGLAHLKGHPSLKVIRLEQSDVKNEDAAILIEIPKLEELDLKKTDFRADAYVTLAKSKTLKKIRAPQTAFDNDCLKAIGGMKQLVALDLTDCNLVTSEGAAPLAGLENLEMLKLYGRSNLDDRVMEHIGKLKKLKVLGLVQTSVSKDGLVHLEGHPNLKELDLYGCVNVKSDGLKSVGTIVNLEILGLRETAVKNDGMQHLVPLKKLKELDLSESVIGVGKNFEAITQLPALVDLNLWQTSFTDADMPAVGQLKNLKRLNLDKTEVTDMGLASIKELENLEYLHLGNTMITDAGLAELHGLKNLKHLVVTFVAGISDDGIAELQQAVPGLTKIDR